MKGFNIIIIGIILLFATSCASNKEKLLTGWWAIDNKTFQYKNHLYPACLLGNVITFEKNHSCKIPTTLEYCPINVDRLNNLGQWRIIEDANGEFKVVISSNNELFDGVYSATFIPDTNEKILKMTIKSENINFECSKGLFDYKLNEKLIRKTLHK